MKRDINGAHEQVPPARRQQRQDLLYCEFMEADSFGIVCSNLKLMLPLYMDTLEEHLGSKLSSFNDGNIQKDSSAAPAYLSELLYPALTILLEGNLPS